MKDLIGLVRVLKKTERISLFKKLSSKKTISNQRKSEILRSIIDEEIDHNTDIRKHLFPEMSAAGFSILKSNLIDEIFSLVREGNPKIHFKTNQFQKKRIARNHLFQGMFLCSRGLSKSGTKEYLKAYEISRDNQLINELLESIYYLTMMKGFYDFSFLDVNLDKVSSNYLDQYFFEREVSKLHGRVSRFNEHSINESIEEFKKNEDEICYLYKEISRFNSDLLRYEFLSTACLYYLKVRNLIEGKKYYNLTLNLVENNPNLKSSKERAALKLLEGNIALQSRHFAEAIQHYQVSYQNYSPTGKNRFGPLERLILCLIYLKRYDESQERINYVLEQILLFNYPMRRARWLFYQANVTYLMGDRDLALKQLRANNEIHKDKSGWLLGFKILEMMITIDNKDFYLVSFMNDRLVQVLHKNKHANIARAKIICQIIRAFLRFDCDFQKTMERVPEKFALLEDEEHEYYWDIMSYEVIRFDQWFRERAQGKRPSSNPSSN